MKNVQGDPEKSNKEIIINLLKSIPNSNNPPLQIVELHENNTYKSINSVHGIDKEDASKLINAIYDSSSKLEWEDTEFGRKTYAHKVKKVHKALYDDCFSLKNLLIFKADPLNQTTDLDMVLESEINDSNAKNIREVIENIGMLIPSLNFSSKKLPIVRKRASDMSGIDYKEILQNANEGIILVRVSKKGYDILDCNESSAKLLGLLKEDILIQSDNHKAINFITTNGNNLKQSMHPVFLALKHRKEGIKNYEIGIKKDNNKLNWLSINCTPIKQNDEKIILVTLRDITTLKHTQLKLQETKKLLSQSSKLAKLGGWEKNLITGTDVWTEMTREIHEVENDFSPSMESGINFYKAGESRQTIIKAVENTIKTGKTFDVEVILITAKGNEKWVRAKGSAKFENGQCIMLYGTIQDIHEQKMAEETALKNELKFKTLFEQIPLGLSICDSEGNFTHHNKLSKKILRKIHSNSKLKHVSQLKYLNFIHDNDQTLPFDELPINNTLKSKTLNKKEVGIKLGDKSTVWMNISTFYLENVGAVVAFEDITESRLLSELTQQQDFLIKANLKGEILFANSSYQKLVEGQARTSGQYDYAALLMPSEKEKYLSNLRYLLNSTEQAPVKTSEEKLRIGQKEIIISWSRKLLKNSKGNPLTIIASGKDITEQKKAAEKIEIFYSLFQEAGSGLAIINRNGTLKQVNNSFARMHGFESEELTGKYFTKLIDDSQAIITKALKNRKHFKGKTVRCIRKNGSSFTAIMNVSFTKLGNNEEYLSVVSIIDISELQKSKSKLSKSIEVQTILRKIASNYINTNLEKTQQTINSSLKELGKLSKSDRAYIFKYNWNMSTCSNTYEWCEEGITPQIKYLQNVSILELEEWTNKHKNGEPFTVSNLYKMEKSHPVRQILEPQGIKSLVTYPLMNGEKCLGFVGFDWVNSIQEKPLFQEEGVLEVFAGMLVNLEVRLQNVRKLEKSVQRFSSIIRLSNNGAWEMDYNKNRLNCSDEYIDMLGYAPEEKSFFQKDGKFTFNDAWVKHLHPDNKDKALKKYHEFKNNPNAKLYEDHLRMVNKKGETIWLWSKAEKLINPENNQTQHIIGSNIDITKIKQQEKNIKDLLRIQESLNENLKNFTHIVSHNLRIHTSNIDGLLSILKDSEEMIYEHELIQMIHKITNRLNFTIDDLNKILSIKFEKNDDYLYLNFYELVEKAIGENANFAKEREVNIYNAIPKTLSIFSSEKYLVYIFKSIINNAIKFSSNDRDSLLHIYVEQNKDCYLLHFKDNGIGIDLESHQDKMFKMYKKLHYSDKSKGVSLFLSKAKAQAIGGDLSVSSIVNEGTIFTVKLSK